MALTTNRLDDLGSTKLPLPTEADRARPEAKGFVDGFSAAMMGIKRVLETTPQQDRELFDLMMDLCDELYPPFDAPPDPT
jgi:hypothetical protein